jgi:ketosteroid isomerase-like protein
MKQVKRQLLIGIITSLVFSSLGQAKPDQDIVNDAFPEAQAEIEAFMDTVIGVCISKDLDGIADVHLKSPKFSKFSSRKPVRMTVAQTIEAEIDHFDSISDLESDLNDLKIDVFGDVAVITYLQHVTFTKGNNKSERSKRVTKVVVKTGAGWKIVHEHGSVIE